MLQCAGRGAQTCLSAPCPTRTRWSRKHSMVCDVSMSTTMIAGSSAAGPTPRQRASGRDRGHRTAASLFLAHPPVCWGPATVLSAEAAASVIRKPRRAARGCRCRAGSAKAVGDRRASRVRPARRRVVTQHARTHARGKIRWCALPSRRQAPTRCTACAPAQQASDVAAPGPQPEPECARGRE